MKNNERSQFLGFLQNFGWQYLVTLNPNTDNERHLITPDFEAKRKWELRRWFNVSDGILLGKRWFRNPNRTYFFAFPERGPKNGLFHWHLLLRAPQSHKEPACAYRDAWRKVCPDGQADIRPIGPGAISYASKNLWTELTLENYVISSDLLPVRHSWQKSALAEDDKKRRKLQHDQLLHCWRAPDFRRKK